MAAAMPYTRGLDAFTPRVELFLGYSYLQAVPELAVGNRLVWLHGGSTSLAFNVNRYLGLVADVGDYTNSQMRFQGAYTSTVNVDNANAAVLSYLFGPRLSYRKYDRVTPFAQALFGGVHANEIRLSNCTVNCILLPSESTFAMTAGGGLDVRVYHHLRNRSGRDTERHAALCRNRLPFRRKSCASNSPALASVLFLLGHATVCIPG
jgi:hypothetical protein